MIKISRAARGWLLAVCAALPWGCKPGMKDLIPWAATPLPCPGTVTGLVYEVYSGPVADRYTERYTVSQEGITFERTGEEGGPVNRGSWPVEAGAGAVEALFATLGAVDCKQIEEIRPDEVPIGGGSVLYRLDYEGGERFGMWYHEGVSYRGAEPITEPVRAFVRALKLPDEAWDTLRQRRHRPRNGGGANANGWPAGRPSLSLSEGIRTPRATSAPGRRSWARRPGTGAPPPGA